MLLQSHAEQDDQWEDDPRGVGEDNQCQVRGVILPEGFFAEDHDYARYHGDRIDDAGQANPLFAFDERRCRSYAALRRSWRQRQSHDLLCR